MSNETNQTSELEIVIKGNQFVKKEIKAAQPKVKPAKPDVIETEEFGNFITAKRAQEILEANNTALVYKAATDNRIRWTTVDGTNYYSEQDVTLWAEQRKEEALIHPRKPRSPNKAKSLVSENGSNGTGEIQSELTVDDLVPA